MLESAMKNLLHAIWKNNFQAQKIREQAREKNESIRLISFLSLLAGLFLLTPSAPAEEAFVVQPNSEISSKSAILMEKWGLTPSLRLGLWEKDKSFSDHKNYGMGSLWLMAHPQDFEATPFHFEGFVQAQDQSKDSTRFGSFEKKPTIHTEIHEFYWQKSFSNFDFRMGRQINVWGRADKINPTDVLSVKNMKLLTTDDEEQRLGLFSTLLTYHFESSKIIALWQPEWRFPVYPMRSTQGIKIHEQRPKNTDQQFGLKWDYSGEGFDSSLSYFSGISKTPDIKMSETLASTPSNIHVDLLYHRIQMIGGDFAFNAGSTALRGEIAYTQTSDPKGDNPWIQNPQLFAVLGADRLIIENFNLNLQFLYKHIEHFSQFQDPQLQPLIDTENRISQQQFENNWGWSLRPSYKLLNESLELETSILYWEKNRESVIRPKITYSLNDHSKLMVGGEFYHGPASSLFGSFKDLSGGFMEWRYYF